MMQMLNVLTPLDPLYVHAKKDFMEMGLHALVRNSQICVLSVKA